MKNILKALIILCSAFAGAQTDSHGNPVFNSVTVKTEQLEKGIELSVNYYTLKNNIENEGSSVFIAKKPTNDDVITAATQLPSDYFVITKDARAVSMLMFAISPVKQIIVVSPSTGEAKTFPISIKGDITENRAKEIIAEKYDPSATLKNGRLSFNGKQYDIIPEKEIEKEIKTLIKKEKLANETPSDMTMLSSEEIKKIMLKETAEGGEFDYFTAIKGKEMNSVQVKPGVFSTELGIALYRWGRAAFELGVNTSDDALAIFSEFKGRPVNQREKEYIKMGFAKELEK